MMKFRKHKREALHIELTPLVDMVFILLIFFMLSASFLKPVIKMKLPVAAYSETAADQKMVMLVVDKNETIFINHKKITFADLKQKITEATFSRGGRKAVVFSADREVDYGFFVKVMDILKQVGVETISLEHDSE